MQYSLRDDLSYCVIDGHAVFLDVAADRYFRLPDHLEHAFVAHVGSCDITGAELSMLVQRGILVKGQARGNHRSDSVKTIDTPTRSALEMPAEHAGSTALALPEVAFTTWSCRRKIGAGQFKDVIDESARYRDQRCSTPSAPPVTACEQKLLQAVRRFQLARMYVPIATRCLLDSLSLSGFLARRNLHSRIVFGVTLDPFSAHCWVQAGDIALNETVGTAMAHTIIMVI